jgi:hypothetical protein
LIYKASKICNLSLNHKETTENRRRGEEEGGGGGGGVTANQTHRKEIRIKYKIKKNRKFSHTKVTDQNNSVGNTKYNTNSEKNSKYNIMLKAIPLQAWTGPKGSRRLRVPDFMTICT